MAKRYTLALGKVAYYGQREIHAVEIEWTLRDGRFSMCGSIWNRSRSDIVAGGQIVDEIGKLFRRNPTVQRMVAIWRVWHLNDMCAGSPKQRDFIKQNGLTGVYESTLRELRAAGLSPDLSYLHNGKPYEYGSAWLTVEIPADVIAEIEAWASLPEVTSKNLP